MVELESRSIEKISVREQLRRSNPQVDGPTYRYVKGEITRSQFEQHLNEERVREGLPALDIPHEGK